MNYGNTDDATGSNTTYGWAKTYTNVFRTGLPGTLREVSGRPTSAPWRTSAAVSRPTDRARTTGRRRGATGTSCARRLATYPEPPVVFLIERVLRGEVQRRPRAECSADVEAGGARPSDGRRDRDRPGHATCLTGDGLYEPPAEVVERARAAAEAAAARFADPPGPLDDLPHQARVLAGLFVLAVLPGLLAAPFFGLKDTPSRIALIPGTSIVMSLLAGIAVLGVWRGPLTETKAWVVVAVAVGAGAALRFGERGDPPRARARSAGSSTACSRSSRTATSRP